MAKRKPTEMFVCVKLDIGTAKPGRARNAFVKALNDYAKQGVMFTTVDDEEIHVVNAKRITAVIWEE